MENLTQYENIKFPKVATEIKKMAEEDQAMRKRAEENQGVIESKEDDTLDERNTIRMREIVSEIGWPTISKVGKDCSHDAWVLVQHADHDRVFQKECLQLMKDAGDQEVEKKDVAYLEDRVRVNEGNLQLYGTQFYEDPIHKIYVLRPVEDLENLGKRREEMGMETGEEYAKNWDKENERILSNAKNQTM